MKMALLSSSSTPIKFPTLSPLLSKSHHPSQKLNLFLLPDGNPRKTHLPVFPLRVSTSDNGAGIVASSTVTVVSEEKVLETSPSEEKVGENSSLKVDKNEVEEDVTPVKASSEEVKKFQDPKWVNGTWDLKQFEKNGSTDWDAVIDAG